MCLLLPSVKWSILTQIQLGSTVVFNSQAVHYIADYQEELLKEKTEVIYCEDEVSYHHLEKL